MIMAWTIVQHRRSPEGERKDADLFRSVRRSAPDYRAIVDQLQAEHQVVSDLLDQVEGAAARGLENSLATEPAGRRAGHAVGPAAGPPGLRGEGPRSALLAMKPGPTA
jgi:hypothetical protein